MLAPDYLDTLPDAVVALWQQVEDDILRDIARRIGKMGEMTETAAWQAWRYGQVQACHQDVVSLLAKYSGKSKEAIRQALLDARAGNAGPRRRTIPGAGVCPLRHRHQRIPQQSAERGLPPDPGHLAEPDRHHGQHRDRRV